MTTSRQSTPLDDIEAVVTRAVSPLVDRLGKVEAKLDNLDSVYARKDVTDKSFEAVQDELKAIVQAMKDQKTFLFQIVAAAGAVLTIIVLFAQHITIH